MAEKYTIGTAIERIEVGDVVEVYRDERGRALVRRATIASEHESTAPIRRPSPPYPPTRAR